MQNQKEIQKINQFLCGISPVVIRFVKMLLQATGLDVKEKGRGTDLAFSIKSGEKEVKFFVYNLLMEIATVDRDEEPLRFDENLRDYDFLLDKTVRLTQSKLKVLFHLLREEDVDAAIENISQDAKQYERIRIWRLDEQDSGKKETTI